MSANLTIIKDVQHSSLVDIKQSQEEMLLSRLKEKIKFEHSNNIVDDEYALSSLDVLDGYEIGSSNSLDEYELAYIYGLGEERYINKVTALKLMSQQEQNKTGNVEYERTISHGQGLTKCIDGIYYKSFPNFLNEHIIFQLNRLFGWDIIAATKLLLIKCHNQDITAVQAALEIEGPRLEEILFIPIAFNILKKLFKNDKTIIEKLAILYGFKQKISLEWLNKENIPKDINPEAAGLLLIRHMETVATNNRPKEFKVDLNREDIRKSILAELQTYKIKDHILQVLRLIKEIPELMKNSTMADLIHFYQLAKNLKKLFPDQTLETILQEAPKILSCFDEENICQHVLLELLTEPSDHKADNYVVKIDFEKITKKLRLKIVGIDNDAALQGNIKELKETFGRIQHEMHIRSVFYSMNAVHHIIIPSNLRKKILDLDPEIIVLEWLSSMVKCLSEYIPLFKLYPSLKRQLQTQKQFTKDKALEIVDRLKLIQNFLRNRHNVTTGELLYEIEPIAMDHNQELLKDSNTLRVMDDLMHKPSSRIIEETLKNNMQKLYFDRTLTDILQSFREKRPNYQSYAEILSELASHIFVKNESNYHLISILVKTQKFGIHYNIKKIILPTAIFTQLYIEHKKDFIHFLHSLDTIEIQFDNITKPISLQDSNILFNALSVNQERTTLVQAILDFYQGKGIHFLQKLLSTKDAHQATILHHAAKKAPDVITLFNSPFVDIDAIDEHSKSALDYGIEIDNSSTISNLISIGAGKTLLMNNGKKFILQYGDRMPEHCMKILSIHSDLAWNLALDNIDKGTPSTKEIIYVNGTDKKFRLNSSLYDQIFPNSGTFPPNSNYVNYVNAVESPITTKVKVGFYLEEYPKLPGREIMVHCLAKILFGQITPTVDLWCFNVKRGDSVQSTELMVPILATHAVTGISLAECLFDPKNYFLLNALDEASVSQAILLAMLINPEDGRPENYIIQPIYHNKGQRNILISINNDHSFVEPINTENPEASNSITANVKTVLFCLDQMKKPVHPSVKDSILNINIQDILNKWIEELSTRQLTINHIFNLEDPKIPKDEREVFLKNNIHLRIEFRTAILRDIAQKLKKIQTFLKENPEISFIDLLRRVIPSLGPVYSQALEIKTLKERFNFVTGKGFIEQEGDTNKATKKIAHYIKKTTTQQLIRITLGQNAEMAKKQKEDFYKPSSTLDWLKTNIDKQLGLNADDLKILKEIREELQSGNIEKFKLLTNEFKEKIINGDEEGILAIRFDEMKLLNGRLNIEYQKKVLQSLTGYFSKLWLSFCEALNEKTLVEMLSSIKGLTDLSIAHCPNLTSVSMINTLISLETLGLEGLPITELEVALPKLSHIKINGCSKLPKCTIRATTLEKMNISSCESLVEISTDTHKLKELRLLDCNKITDRAVNKLTNSSFSINLAIIRGCNTRYSKFYEKYPQLLVLPLYQFNVGFINTLDVELEKMLLSSSLSPKNIPQQILKFLHVHIYTWISNLGILIKKKIRALDLNDLIEFRSKQKHREECLLSIEQEMLLFIQNHPLTKKDSMTKKDSVEYIPIIPIQTQVGLHGSLSEKKLEGHIQFALENLQNQRRIIKETAITILIYFFESLNLDKIMSLKKRTLELLYSEATNPKSKIQYESIRILLEVFELLPPSWLSHIFKTVLGIVINSEPYKDKGQLLQLLKNTLIKKKNLPEAKDIVEEFSNFSGAMDSIYKIKWGEILVALLYNNSLDVNQRGEILNQLRGLLLDSDLDSNPYHKRDSNSDVQKEIINLIYKTISENVLTDSERKSLATHLLKLINHPDPEISLPCLSTLSKLSKLLTQKEKGIFEAILTGFLTKPDVNPELLGVFDQLLKNEADYENIQTLASLLIPLLDNDNMPKYKILMIISKKIEYFSDSQFSSFYTYLLPNLTNNILWDMGSTLLNAHVAIFHEILSSRHKEKFKENIEQILVENEKNRLFLEKTVFEGARHGLEIDRSHTQSPALIPTKNILLKLILIFSGLSKNSTVIIPERGWIISMLSRLAFSKIPMVPALAGLVTLKDNLSFDVREKIASTLLNLQKNQIHFLENLEVFQSLIVLMNDPHLIKNRNNYLNAVINRITLLFEFEYMNQDEFLQKTHIQTIFQGIHFLDLWLSRKILLTSEKLSIAKLAIELILATQKSVIPSAGVRFLRAEIIEKSITLLLKYHLLDLYFSADNVKKTNLIEEVTRVLIYFNEYAVNTKEKARKSDFILKKAEKEISKAPSTSTTPTPKDDEHSSDLEKIAKENEQVNSDANNAALHVKIMTEILIRILFEVQLSTKQKDIIMNKLSNALEKNLSRMWFNLQTLFTSENVALSIIKFCKLEYSSEKVKQTHLSPSKSASNQSLPDLILNMYNKPEKPFTLADGNCALNAVALGLCDLIIQNRINSTEFYKKFSEFLKLPEASRDAILNWLDKLNNVQRQKKLATILRKEAIEFVEQNYVLFKETFEADLLNAFKKYKQNLLEDTFSIHEHIRLKFEELRNTPHTPKANENDSKDLKELIDWWRFTGRDKYFSIIKQPAIGITDFGRWGSMIEIQALGYIFHICIKAFDNATLHLCGIGYGLIKELEKIDAEHLAALNVGSFYGSLGFVIGINNREKLEKILNRTTLLPAERTLLNQEGKTQALNYLNGDPKANIVGVDCMDSFCKKLQSLEVVVPKNGGGYRFVHDELLNFLITPFEDSLKKLVLSKFEPNTPCFAIEHTENHWSYIGESPSIADFRAPVSTSTAPTMEGERNILHYMSNFATTAVISPFTQRGADSGNRNDVKTRL